MYARNALNCGTGSHAITLQQQQQQQHDSHMLCVMCDVAVWPWESQGWNLRGVKDGQVWWKSGDEGQGPQEAASLLLYRMTCTLICTVICDNLHQKELQVGEVPVQQFVKARWGKE